MNSVLIGSRAISPQEKCYIIAEIGVNHNGDVKLAHRLIDVAKTAGADAVKFQTYCTDSLVRSSASKATYQLEQTGEGSQHEMLRKFELTRQEFTDLRLHCEEVGIDFMSTAFDESSLEFVASLHPSCIKWPSGEIDNINFLRKACNLDLPVVLSTGMSSIADISRAVDCMIRENQQNFVILQCTSLYPAPLEVQNLKCIPALQQAFNCPVGFSDHTAGLQAAIAARALGMCVLEKHITLDRAMDGPDHQASIDSGDFKTLVDNVRSIELALGTGFKAPHPLELNVKAVARRSLVYTSDFESGHVLTEIDVSSKRPADGLPPTMYDQVLGSTILRPVLANTCIQFADLG